MVDQKDHDLVTLTSAAAWIRGLEIATRVVLSSESLQGKEELRQPDLARRLAVQLNAIPDRMKRGLLVPAVMKTLESTAILLEDPETNPETLRDRFSKVHDDCSAVVKLILNTPAPASALSHSSISIASPGLSPKSGSITNSSKP